MVRRLRVGWHPEDQYSKEEFHELLNEAFGRLETGFEKFLRCATFADYRPRKQPEKLNISICRGEEPLAACAIAVAREAHADVQEEGG